MRMITVDKEFGGGMAPHWEHTMKLGDVFSDDDESDNDSDVDLDSVFCYQCPIFPNRRHPSAECCHCAANAR